MLQVDSAVAPLQAHGLGGGVEVGTHDERCLVGCRQRVVEAHGHEGRLLAAGIVGFQCVVVGAGLGHAVGPLGHVLASEQRRAVAIQVVAGSLLACCGLAHRRHLGTQHEVAGNVAARQGLPRGFGGVETRRPRCRYREAVTLAVDGRLVVDAHGMGRLGVGVVHAIGIVVARGHYIGGGELPLVPCAGRGLLHHRVGHVLAVVDGAVLYHIELHARERGLGHIGGDAVDLVVLEGQQVARGEFLFYPHLGRRGRRAAYVVAHLAAAPGERFAAGERLLPGEGAVELLGTALEAGRRGQQLAGTDGRGLYRGRLELALLGIHSPNHIAVGAVGLVVEHGVGAGEQGAVHLAAVAIHVVALGGGGGVVPHDSRDHEVAHAACVPGLAVIAVHVALACGGVAVGVGHKVLIGAVLVFHHKHHVLVAGYGVGLGQSCRFPRVLGKLAHVDRRLAHEFLVFIHLHPHLVGMSVLKVGNAVDRLAGNSLQVGRGELGCGIESRVAFGIVGPAAHAVVVASVVPFELDGGCRGTPAQAHLREIAGGCQRVRRTVLCHDGPSCEGCRAQCHSRE